MRPGGETETAINKELGNLNLRNETSPPVHNANHTFDKSVKDRLKVLHEKDRAIRLRMNVIRYTIPTSSPEKQAELREEYNQLVERMKALHQEMDRLKTH